MIEPGKSPYAEAAERHFTTVRERFIERRRALGLSMSALARSIGVSPSMISQIERGQSLPSVETLFALAAALDSRVDMFFDEPAPSERTAVSVNDDRGGAPAAAPPFTEPVGAHRYLVRQAQRAAIDIQGGVRWERLTPHELEFAEFLELIYEPGTQSNENLFFHPGFEMVLVLEGRFDIYIAFERYELYPGDSIAFSSALPHRYVNPLSQVARAVTVILRDRDTGVPAGTDALPPAES